MKALIDLTLLNDLVKALNKEVEASNTQMPDLHISQKTFDTDFIIQLGKTLGLASTIAVEATALVGDISKCIKQNSVPLENPTDALLDILGGKSFAKKLD